MGNNKSYCAEDKIYSTKDKPLKNKYCMASVLDPISYVYMDKPICVFRQCDLPRKESSYCLLHIAYKKRGHSIPLYGENQQQHPPLPADARLRGDADLFEEMQSFLQNEITYFGQSQNGKQLQDALMKCEEDHKKLFQTAAQSNEVYQKARMLDKKEIDKLRRDNADLQTLRDSVSKEGLDDEDLKERIQILSEPFLLHRPAGK
jgi:hypothetical protein